MKIRPKNWREFQHYKNRRPPWIRLHRLLLDNFEFHRLPLASRALAPMLWLIASECVDGILEASSEALAFRLRTSEKDIVDGLTPLIQSGFFEVVHDASNSLAERGQSADSEAEAEALQRQRESNARDGVPRGTADPEHAEWLATLAIYPPGAQRQDLIGAEKAARHLVESGAATWQKLREGVTRYAACVKATDRLVLNPVKFFTDRDKPWSQAWPIPPPKKSFAQAQQDGVTARFLASGT